MLASRRTTLKAPWAGVMRLAVLGALVASAAPSYAADPEKFLKVDKGHAGPGSFTREARDGTATWVETSNTSQNYKCIYTETGRDQNWIHIRDASRNFEVALPIAGGMAKFTNDKYPGLNDYSVLEVSGAPTQFLKGNEAGGSSFTRITGDLTTTWVETADTADFKTTFTETGRDQNWIRIRDASRNLEVALPIAGGMCQWSDDNGQKWNDLCQVRVGATNSIAKGAGVKVVALFAIDSDPTVRESTSIKKTGDLAIQILHTYCPKKYRSTAPHQMVLQMNRSPGAGKPATKPSDLLAAIAALNTTANDVIFVYACCHGGYSGNDHRLFLARNDDDEVTWLERADVVAALKKKASYAVVFLTDACSTYLPVDLGSPGSLDETDGNARLYRAFASLPRGAFLDINTSSKGQISGMTTSGAVATSALCWALDDPAVTSWDALQKAWQEKLTINFKQIRSRALNGLGKGDTERKKYEDQEEQLLDVKRQ